MLTEPQNDGMTDMLKTEYPPKTPGGGAVINISPMGRQLNDYLYSLPPVWKTL